MPYPLTQEEAHSFIENVLKIPDHRELIKDGRLNFLNVFTKQMNIVIPFTNIQMASQPFTGKRCTTFLECKEDVLKRIGGHCFYMNVFSKALLDRLGFKTFHVGR